VGPKIPGQAAGRRAQQLCLSLLRYLR
jgi:hypothetical protein